jgi:hypothetical protein
MKSQNKFNRVASTIKGSEQAKSSRSHNGKAASKGMVGEAGAKGAKAYIVRNHMLSNRDKK